MSVAVPPGQGARNAASGTAAAPVAVRTLLDVLPRGTEAQVEVEVDAASPRSTEGPEASVRVAGRRLRVGWAGEGTLRRVAELVAEGRGRYDVVTARHLSPGARDLLGRSGIGWADQSGAAEIVTAGLVVSRSGRPPARGSGARWTRATLAVAEALLCGVPATVAAVTAATGLSTGAATAALRLLTDRGLLAADAARGRGAARRLDDPDRLLTAYVEADAVVRVRRPAGLAVGLQGRDLVGALATVGRTWDAAGVAWAATGAAAAAVLAPLLTTVSAVEAYVDAPTSAALEARAADAGLRPIEGGRLTLRPFPTVAVPRLAELRDLADLRDGVRVAPWPRVYVDLLGVGVRGEEAAEHLRLTVGAGPAGTARG